MAVAALAAGNNDSRFICKHRCVFSDTISAALKKYAKSPGQSHWIVCLELSKLQITDPDRFRIEPNSD
jgi:hypothetical protein